ncbi:hypothetical protein WJX73_008107 [Symbiochloris irregularis]|uniref:Flavanone 4-reductase n=1 Tax=Symbiochloris irregularis TaxID=706552 RepID=A0AAW1PC10_9CHLO
MAEKVLVTGATGFLATHVVAQLLEKGYTVHATVRSLNSSKSTYLNKLADVLPGHLHLFQADLLQQGSFDQAVKGCKVIFHTASPFVFGTADPQKMVIDPAVQGTKAVLASAVAHKDTVKRIILTSSVAAVHGEYAAPPRSGKLYTEEDWNETSSAENDQHYHLSKVLAEREALKQAKEHSLDVVSICPNFILGPPLSPHAEGVSFEWMKALLEGQPPSGTPIICDVRDVARAHVLAAETPSASGRYIALHLVLLVVSLAALSQPTGAVDAPAYNCSVIATRGETNSFGALGCAGRGSPYCCNGSPLQPNFPGTYNCKPDTSLVLYGGGCSGSYQYAGCCPVSVANCTTLQAYNTPANAFGHG